ncbi:hypothetical protein LLH00_08320 [bacterium]|nr:hypothetical protein [bacterium]
MKLNNLSTGRGLVILIAAVLACVFTARGLRAQEQNITTLETRFIQANRSYSQGEYEQAAKEYAELLKLSGPSAGLYYNLGCAQLKANQLGPATASFHRAARLAPRDKDIRANLRFVQALTRPENSQEEGEDFLSGPLLGWMFLLSDREVGFSQLVLLGWATLGATFLVAGYAGRARRLLIWATLAGTFLLLANSALLSMHWYRQNYFTEAVVLEANSEARSGPGEENNRVMVLPEGTLVRLGESRNGWVLVSLPSGSSGWMPAARLEQI